MSLTNAHWHLLFNHWPILGPMLALGAAAPLLARAPATGRAGRRWPTNPHFFKPEPMKVLSPPAQGTLDYLLIIWLAMGPTALGFTGVNSFMCYLLAGLYLLVVLSTDFSMGVVRVLSYRALGGLELVSALVFLGSPFLFGFAHTSPTARTFFMSFGAALLVLWALTDWSGRVNSEMPDEQDNLDGNRV